MKYDVYSYDKLLGTVEAKGDKLVIGGPKAKLLRDLCDELSGDSNEVMEKLPEMFRGVMHIRPHGESIRYTYKK